MKKILLSFSLLAAVFATKAQTVLNEVYAEPGNGKSEFIELYNSAFGDQPTDCFAILTYWSSDLGHGWYVLDLPAGTIPAKKWYVTSATSPFNTQSTTGSVADFSWNDPNFRNGSTGGYLKKYEATIGGYSEIDITNDSIYDLSGKGDFYNGPNYLTLLVQDGVVINGFWGGGPTGILPATITGLPNLTATHAGACSATPYIIDFSEIGAVENVNSAPGSDNGYARTSDGKCGSWVKTSAQVNHTPGKSNGSAVNLTGSLTTEQVIVCNTGPGVSKVVFDVTGFTGDVSLSADFAVTVQFYRNLAPFDSLTGTDIILGSMQVADTSQLPSEFVFPQTYQIMMVYKTKRGCFDKVVRLINTCAPLPVKFKSFTATRTNSTNVAVKWETLSEENAAGFAVERNIRGTWEQVAYIPSQAAGGNSNSALTYQLNDLNAAKGISQYRIRQEDLDGAAKLSDIRSVRGEGQKGSTIVYPNPSSDGRVNVVFAGGEITKRNVSVQDMSGRTVKQWSNYSNNNIQIENLTPGFYTIRIVDIGTGEQSVEKIVVNKR